LRRSIVTGTRIVIEFTSRGHIGFNIRKQAKVATSAQPVLLTLLDEEIYDGAPTLSIIRLRTITYAAGALEVKTADRRGVVGNAKSEPRSE
jgi:hypothetical protein